MVKIYTDGSTTDICFVVAGHKPQVQPAVDSTILCKVTVNEGEYYAVIQALQYAASHKLGKVEILADSQLIVNQLTQKPNGNYVYETKNQRLLNLRGLVKMLEHNFEAVKYQWIPRESNLAGQELERRKRK